MRSSAPIDKLTDACQTIINANSDISLMHICVLMFECAIVWNIQMADSGY